MASLLPRKKGRKEPLEKLRYNFSKYPTYWANYLTYQTHNHPNRCTSFSFWLQEHGLSQEKVVVFLLCHSYIYRLLSQNHMLNISSLPIHGKCTTKSCRIFFCTVTNHHVIRILSNVLRLFPYFQRLYISASFPWCSVFTVDSYATNPVLPDPGPKI